MSTMLRRRVLLIAYDILEFSGRKVIGLQVIIEMELGLQRKNGGFAELFLSWSYQTKHLCWIIIVYISLWIFVLPKLLFDSNFNCFKLKIEIDSFQLNSTSYLPSRQGVFLLYY